MGYLAVLVFWIIVSTSVRIAWTKWRDWRYRQPARYISEIKGLHYFRVLPAHEFELILKESLREHQYALLGNPYLTGSKEQGYVWKAGKKAVLVTCLDKAPTAEDLTEIAKRQQKAGADRVLVFTPFAKVPNSSHLGMEVLSDKKFLHWFSVLKAIRPPSLGTEPGRKCDCGSPVERSVNRAGALLLICSNFPDCRQTVEPGKGD